MNIENFDAAVRAAYPLATRPESLDRRLADAVDAVRRGRQIRRRWVASFATVSVAGIALWAAPALRAEAALARMQGALDGVTVLTMRRTSIDAAGHRFPAGTTVYDHGKWRLERVGASTLMIYMDGKTYNFDPTLHAFQVEDRPNGPFSHMTSFKVSDMIGVIGNPLTRRATIDSVQWGGKAVRRVRLDNGSLPERYTFLSDPETDLPIAMQVEGKALGQWRVSTEMTFEYGVGLSPDQFAPELRRFPVVTAEEAERRFNAEMTKQELGGFPQKRGRLVVRRFDVAEDGTVFVAYQSGERSTHVWRGFAFELKSDDGAAYARPQIFNFSEPDSIPEDGVLQTEAFIPVEPRQPWRPRRYTLTAYRFADGNLGMQTEMISYEPGGRQTKFWVTNGRSRSETNAKPVIVLSRRIEHPTCQVAPAYTQRIAFNDFGNAPTAGITEDRARAEYYLDRQDWSNAVRWLDAELFQMSEFTRQGYGTYSEDEPRRKREEALRAMGSRP